ncbi:MAG: hypothetical protein IJN64_17800 [Lachnospiraceae bacterium]|nr:hypothetical protein [Lachnospiraceae bacterium]
MINQICIENWIEVMEHVYTLKTTYAVSILADLYYVELMNVMIFSLKVL